jgi:hypothetical protein
MNEPDKTIFINLFREAYLKCFGFQLTAGLSETDCKHFSNKIFESTGLVIGPKSIKNYSFFVANYKEGREENPSIATLDTFSRYVLGAPYTNEISRKEKEEHYPWWFRYRSKYPGNNTIKTLAGRNLKKISVIMMTIIIVAACFFVIKTLTGRNKPEYFTDDFNSVLVDSLQKHGWLIKSIDPVWWNKRGEKPGNLTLYTLKGDNWSDSGNVASIKNLLMRKISSDCFMVETNITNFFPEKNWQQAGILISEDSTFSGRMIRFSISYNDFFGGYNRPPEIIIQIVSYLQPGVNNKPEEIAHYALSSIEPGQRELVKNNLRRAALRIEKKDNHFRFLYTASPGESFAFKEVVNGDFDFHPKYASIFAIHGWAKDISPVPVHFDSFTLAGTSCKK